MNTTHYVTAWSVRRDINKLHISVHFGHFGHIFGSRNRPFKHWVKRTKTTGKRKFEVKYSLNYKLLRAVNTSQEVVTPCLIRVTFFPFACLSTFAALS